jgi:hypothetical protein
VLGRERASASFGARVQRELMAWAPSVARFHFLDPTQYARACQRSPSQAHRFRLTPGPVESFDAMSPAAARAALGLPLHGRYAAVISPDPTKGVERLFELLEGGACPSDTRLIIAGRVHAAVEHAVRRLASHGGRERVIVLRHLTDERDLHTVICAADVVIGRLQPQEGLSDMCIRAALAGRRFFAASTPWMDMMARELGLGVVFTDSKGAAFAAALRHALDTARAPIDPALVDRLRRYHAPGNFEAAMSDRLGARTGRPVSTREPWESVLDARPVASPSHVA